MANCRLYEALMLINLANVFSTVNCGESAINSTAIAASDGKFFGDWLLTNLLGITTTSPKPEEPKICQRCVCGTVGYESRIVNGSESKPLENPWMVYITHKGAFLCGATIISNRYLLASAHGIGIELLRAVFLDHDRSTNSETTSFTRSINQIVRHRKFVFNQGFDNDLALLKLSKDLDLSSQKLTSICLPKMNIADESLIGKQGKVLGWGSKTEFGPYSNTLQEIAIPIWSNEDCKKTDYGDSITDNMICAGYPEGIKDSCKGDTGGPLQIEMDGRTFQIGIVSWGNGCSVKNSPGVYTRVSNYVEWIKNNTLDACFCNP